MTPRSPAPSSRTGLCVLAAALGAGLVAGIAWRWGSVELESRDARPLDAQRRGSKEPATLGAERAKAPRADLRDRADLRGRAGAPEPGPEVAPWLRPPAFAGAGTDTFALALPERVTYAPDCDGIVPPAKRVTDPRSYLRERGVEAGALLPRGGRLYSWTRYFLAPGGGEASVVVRRVGPEKWVVRARIKAGPETKPGQSAARAVRLAGYDGSAVDEARARELAATAHAQVGRLATEALGRTAVLGLPSTVDAGEGAEPAGHRDLIELRNGEILRATLHSEAASCETRGDELACECASPFGE